MAGFDNLVVALGCTQGDGSLIDYAGLLARLGGSKEVHFVHVAETDVPRAPIREQMRARIASQFQFDGPTECDVLTGPLTDRLLAYTTEVQADLILIGSKKRVLGSRLAMLAPCSVAIIPAGHPAQLTHLMIAIDFSEAAGDALQWATSLADGDRNIRCTALHVMTRESADMFASGESEAEQTEAMRKILARADRNGVEVKPRLVEATPSGDIGRRHHFAFPASIEGADVAAAILDEAEDAGADCIALSTRGRSGSASILLGSVTEKVIERASTPLLIAKHFGASLGLSEILLGRLGSRSGFKTN